MDDDLYNLFSDGLTVARTPGININTMQEATLRALVPQMTKDEVADFFKFRDDTTVDNTFKKDSDFWDYITKNVIAFRGDSEPGQYGQTGPSAARNPPSHGRNRVQNHRPGARSIRP